MKTRYDDKWVERFFDEYGQREWDRLVQDPANEVKLHVHRHYLERYVPRGSHVLEVGAGAGRFTQVLAELGANVTVVDISGVQLELNRKYAAELGFEHAVRRRLKLDICGMSAFAEEAFDVVVCYGGPLSYVFEKRTQAMGEILRVLKPGGLVLVSVMSLWGAVHKFLPSVVALPAEINARIIGSGDLCPQTWEGSTHHCHMFTAGQLSAFLERSGATVLAMSASDCLSGVWGERLDAIRKDPEQWRQVLDMEIQACREPGCVDMGTHMIAVARKSDPGRQPPEGKNRDGTKQRTKP